MIFNSLTYIFMLATVVVLYWNLPRMPRLAMLFIASLIFYSFWRFDFVFVMLLSVVVDYVVALRIPDARAWRRTALVLTSLTINLCLLFFFKYLLFFAEAGRGLAAMLGVELDPIILNIILPIGISFYTFQTISYTLDVHRNFIKPERNFLLYGTYVIFFPQLIAGPILRAKEVIPQLDHRSLFEWEHISAGTRRVIYGLFLKVVIADNIAGYVDDGFSHPVDQLSAIDVWTLAFLFGFQIYFDFSAYSHIAIGSARMMGIVFPENFNFPYFASSPRDFWRRWHISLSSWIRDYLYLPLAGAQVYDRSTGGLGSDIQPLRATRALFLTWAIMGLWHGAAWTFVIWGLYHATVIYLHRLLTTSLTSTTRLFQPFPGILLTMPVMMLGWIPFRADSLDTTLNMWFKVLQPSQYGFIGLRENVYLVAALTLVVMTIAWAVHDYLTKRDQARENVSSIFNKVLLPISAAATLAIATALLLVFLRPISQFIYFQF